MKVVLNADWTEFLSVLISNKVRFLLVGGHAVAAHGEPRLTEDLDVFVEPTLANAERLRAALAEFGFGDLAPRPKDLAIANKIWMLGRKPWRIDILTGIDGVTFREAWASRIEVEFTTRPLYVIGRGAATQQAGVGAKQGLERRSHSRRDRQNGAASASAP